MKFSHLSAKYQWKSVIWNWYKYDQPSPHLQISLGLIDKRLHQSKDLITLSLCFLNCSQLRTGKNNLVFHWKLVPVLVQIECPRRFLLPLCFQPLPHTVCGKFQARKPGKESHLKLKNSEKWRQKKQVTTIHQDDPLFIYFGLVFLGLFLYSLTF